MFKNKNCDLNTGDGTCFLMNAVHGGDEGENKQLMLFLQLRNNDHTFVDRDYQANGLQIASHLYGGCTYIGKNKNKLRTTDQEDQFNKMIKNHGFDSEKNMRMMPSDWKNDYIRLTEKEKGFQN